MSLSLLSATLRGKRDFFKCCFRGLIFYVKISLICEHLLFKSFARWSVSQAKKDKIVKINLDTGYIGMLSLLFKNWLKLTCVRLFKHFLTLWLSKGSNCKPNIEYNFRSSASL